MYVDYFLVKLKKRKKRKEAATEDVCLETEEMQLSLLTENIFMYLENPKE